MRLAAVASLGLFVVLSIAVAQQVHQTNPSGFGSVLYPGTGTPPASANGAFGSVLFPGTGAPGARIPVTRPGGSSIATRPLPPPPAHPPHSRALIVPYPVYYGGNYSDGSNAYAQQPAPAYDYGLADAQPGPPPVVIVNQGYSNQGYSNPGYSNQGYRPEYASPVMRDYSNTPLPEPLPDPQPTIYLVAMSDHTIIPTIAYWADGDTVIYITTEGIQNRVSLSLIDREFSYKLNESRNVEFKLPATK